MTDFAALLTPDKGQPARSIHLVDAPGFDDWLSTRPAAQRSAIAAQSFSAKPGSHAILTGDSDDWDVAGGVADRAALTPWCLARLGETLPEGAYRLVEAQPGAAALGWLLAQHRFDRYKKEEKPRGARILLTSDVARIAPDAAQAQAVALVRDLVNTPAADMGPGELQSMTEVLAKAHGAVVSVTKGHDLEIGYPMIHAVGQAADKRHAPRLIELLWGDPSAPRIAIIGKGVCFDSGGLDIKPASGMRLMKKDMGGAAHALALAGLVMRSRLPVRLHLLVPAVENAIAGNAFRPGDVLRSRKGPSVEISNTDAEGRLVLADALAKAVEDKPELILDFATLTGAARVALGPELPALFSNDDLLATALLEAGAGAHDPVWRMPLWPGYRDMLKSEIADIDNAPEGGMAGAITAALFLERFVPAEIPWAHLDTFSWMSSAKPGRPKGGEALGLRAAFAMLLDRHPPR